MKVDSGYLAVKDRGRAEDFWEAVLEREPTLRNERFTFFDLDGFLFGLFDPTATSESITVGNNSIFCLRVPDADAEHDRLSSLAEVVLPLQTVGDYRVFQIRDTEGNTVEFYSEIN